jgi:hypothetical protein
LNDLHVRKLGVQQSDGAVVRCVVYDDDTCKATLEQGSDRLEACADVVSAPERDDDDVDSCGASTRGVGRARTPLGR